MFNRTAIFIKKCTFLGLSLAVFIQSCRQIKEDNTPIAKTVGDNLSNIQQDTTKPFANYYTFNNALDTEKNIRRGWIDTFTINKRRFRVSSDSDYALIIEYYQQGTWHVNTSEQYHAWDFGIGSDINNDGYNDLIITHRLGVTVVFFNPVVNLFDTVSWEMKHDDTLLERKRLIHYNFCEDIADPMTSELYTFKGIRPYYYYIIHYVYGNKDADKPADEFIGLWKCKNGDEDIDKAKLIRKIKLHRGEYPEDYDYRKFWIENYKVLLKNY